VTNCKTAARIWSIPNTNRSASFVYKRDNLTRWLERVGHRRRVIGEVQSGAGLIDGVLVDLGVLVIGRQGQREQAGGIGGQIGTGTTRLLPSLGDEVGVAVFTGQVAAWVGKAATVLASSTMTV